MLTDTSLISHPATNPLHPEAIKNIIFDFGGVICNIDAKLTEKAFLDLGAISFDKKESITESAGLFEKLEIGTISPDQFRTGLRHFFNHPLSDNMIDKAWNALLLDIPPERIRLLEQLRNNYRIFLLSNSNKIHYDRYVSDFHATFGYNDFDELFEKAWFSFNIGLKKPHRVIFDYVVEHSNLVPAETLFIDDTLVHVQGASEAGLHAHHLQIGKGQSVLELFKPVSW